jgi:hypothetical protein
MIDVQLPEGLEFAIEVDIIIAMDGSFLFGVGYHRWLVATKDGILMAVGGPYDGQQDQMTSSQSEFGGIAAGLGFLSTLKRSGLIIIHAVILMCDNSVAVLESRQYLTMRVFHCTKSDFDLIETIKYLEKERRRDIDVRYSWAKDHVNRLNHPLTRNE